jgi:ribosomal protein S18 acetylase RimI-like enzyme
VPILRLPTRVWHLVLPSPDALRPARDPGPQVTVVRAELPVGALNRYFYEEVGRPHHWVDRLSWSPDRWQAYAERPELETWIVYDRGTPLGYAELEARADGSQRVNFFGLVEAGQGRGLGGHLLTEVARRGWARGARQVELDTCELDGPHALANYRARGFEVRREAVEPRGRRREQAI